MDSDRYDLSNDKTTRKALIGTFKTRSEITAGSGKAAVAHQELDGAQVGALFQQMGGKAVAQRVHRHRLGQAGILPGVMADYLQSSHVQVAAGIAAGE